MSRCLEIGVGGTGQELDTDWGCLVDPCCFSPWQGRAHPCYNHSRAFWEKTCWDPGALNSPDQTKTVGLRNGTVSSIPTFCLAGGSGIFWG